MSQPSLGAAISNVPWRYTDATGIARRGNVRENLSENLRENLRGKPVNFA